MASSENVTNESSGDFHDGAYDPDLEARLYAEIYHTNEAYTPNGDSSVTNDAQSTRASSTTSLSETPITGEPVAPSEENPSTIDNFVPARGENVIIGVDENSRAPQARCSKSTWISKEPVWAASRVQRSLAREGLWATPNAPPKGRVVADDSASSRNRAAVGGRKSDTPRERIRLEKRKTRRANSGADDASVTTDATSKYKVVSKKKKLKMIQRIPEPVNISSDSDDSILEVPVPPKAPPVVIHLPDSDDDCSRSGDVSGDASGNPARIVGESSGGARNTPEAFVEPARPDNSSIVLNCTEIQRCASSLDEIRNTRETAVVPIHAHSDDSMTESEANNWLNIAAGQSDVARDEEIGSNDAANSALWKQLSQENTAATIASSPGVESSIDANRDPSVTTRKRPKDLSPSPATRPDVSSIPEKRSKRGREKSSREQSLTEYFFKPMSKKLQAFYNNPWGGENMNLYDIQSRMPKNPKCWTILEADLRGPTAKRRRACPRCRTDSHFGKRCPEKAKAPSCYMCGAKGHTESRCPHTMCLTCGRKYATYRPTCGYCSKLNCDMCKGSGHGSENCPDLWRRYHNTTSETLPVPPREAFDIMKAPQLLTCCNCAKRGHDVTMCNQLRWSQHFPTPIYVSSYTRGPFYESSDDPHEISRHHSAGERIDDPDDEPALCESSHRETIDNDAAGRVIETAAAAAAAAAAATETDFGTPRDEPSRSISHATTIIFESGDFEPSEASNRHRISRRLDDMPNVHLDGLASGRLAPIFLHEWQRFIPFRIEITRDSCNKVDMKLEARTSVLVQALDAIVVQWLSRNDDEKAHLEYDTLPYDNPNAMKKLLRLKIVLLRTVLEPAALHRKIVAIKEHNKHINAKVLRTSDGKKFRRRCSQFDLQTNILTKRRAELVTSLYSRSLVNGADDTVRSFRQLVHKNVRNPDKWSLRDYLRLIYLNNEIFTTHTSAALSEALDRALSESTGPRQAAAPVEQASPIVLDTRDDSNGPEKNSIDFSVYSSPLPSQNPEEITVVEDRGGESSRIPTVFGIDETASANGEILADLNAQWSAPFRPVVANESGPSPPSSPSIVTRSNSRRLIGRKRIEANQGLLRLLTKRNRKFYRNAARDVIKLANSSNLPYLQEMAKSMKFKMGHGTATMNDVHELQSEIETATCQKFVPKAPQSNGPRQSLLNNYKKAYQDFHKTV